MIPGLDAVSARALQRVVTAVAAEEIQVRPRDVNVTLTDDRGLLAITVTSPMRLDPLGSRNDRSGILTRCGQARANIRSRTEDIAGTQVRSVAIRITRASIRSGSRVQ